MNIKLTVYFEDPFWIGVFERAYENCYEIAKLTFGSEPKDYEIYEFILKNFYNLKFSKPVQMEDKKESKLNPKRLQRKVKKETKSQGVGTKAQEAIKLEIENRKVERRVFAKEIQEEDKRRKFKLKQEKKREKKKGH